MTGPTLRSLPICLMRCLLPALFLVAGVAGAQPAPLETAAFAPADEVKPVLEEFFGNLTTQDVVTASKNLFAIFPISPQGKEGFANKITIMKGKLGNLTGCEFLGYRRFGLSQRYVVVYYFTFHDLMPVLWEFSFYRPKAGGPWQLNFIRFESDDLMEFLAFPKLQFEVLGQQREKGSKEP
ncbi:MAG: hypothetical protein GX442_01595 [Candidatus Riflebacteria bacterium]|nr:hypothetical protein [Candidatus Riflebacteria bacterium]